MDDTTQHFYLLLSVLTFYHMYVPHLFFLLHASGFDKWLVQRPTKAVAKIKENTGHG